MEMLVGIGIVSILYVERRSLEEKDTFHIKSRTRRRRDYIQNPFDKVVE